MGALDRLRPFELRFAIERGRLPRAIRIEPERGERFDQAFELDVERFQLERRAAAEPALGPMPARDRARLLALRRELRQRRS